VPPDLGHLEFRGLVEKVLPHGAILSRSVTTSVRTETGSGQGLAASRLVA
jgi:hypothetical protein